MSIQALYNTTVEVRRDNETSDGQGGVTKTPVLVGTVRGRISPASLAERTVASREESLLTDHLYCDESDAEDIQRQDVLTEPSTSRTFKVLGIRYPSVRGQHVRVDLESRARAG